MVQYRIYGYFFLAFALIQSLFLCVSSVFLVLSHCGFSSPLLSQKATPGCLDTCFSISHPCKKVVGGKKEGLDKGDDGERE